MPNHIFLTGGGEAERRLVHFASEAGGGAHVVETVIAKLEHRDAKEALGKLDTTERALIAAQGRAGGAAQDVQKVRAKLLTAAGTEFRHQLGGNTRTPEEALAKTRTAFAPLRMLNFALNPAKNGLVLAAESAPGAGALNEGADPLGTIHGILDYTDGLNGKKAERATVNPEIANKNRGLLALLEFANSGGSIVGSVTTEDQTDKVYDVGMDGNDYLTQYRFHNGHWEVLINAKGGNPARWEANGRNPDVPRHDETNNRNPAMAAKINALTGVLLQSNAETFPASDSRPAHLQLRRQPPQEVSDPTLTLRVVNEEIARLRTEGPSRVPNIGLLLRYVTELQTEDARRAGMMEAACKKHGTSFVIVNDTLRATFPASADEAALARIPERLAGCAYVAFQSRSGNNATLWTGRTFWTGDVTKKLDALATLHTGTENLQSVFDKAEPPKPPEPLPGKSPEQMAKRTDETAAAVINAFKNGVLPDIAMCTAAQQAMTEEERAVNRASPRATALAQLKQSLFTTFACVGLVRTHGEAQALWSIAEQPTASRADLQASSDAFDRERAQVSSVMTILTRPGNMEIASKAVDMIGWLITEPQPALTALENSLFRRQGQLRGRIAAMPVPSSTPTVPSAPGTSSERNEPMPEGLPDPRSVGNTRIPLYRAHNLYSELFRLHPANESNDYTRDPAVQARLNALDAYRNTCNAEKARRVSLVDRHTLMPGLSAKLEEPYGDDWSTLTVVYPAGTDLTALREAMSMREGGTAVLKDNTLTLKLPASFWQNEERAAVVIASFKDFVPSPSALPTVPVSLPGSDTPSAVPQSPETLRDATDAHMNRLEEKLRMGRHATIDYTADLEALESAARAELSQGVPAASARGRKLLAAMSQADRLKPMVRVRRLYQNRTEGREEIRLAKRAGRSADGVRERVRNAIQQTTSTIAEAETCDDQLSLFLGGVSKRGCIANLRADLLQFEKDLKDPFVELRKERGEAFLQSLLADGTLETATHKGVPCLRWKSVIPIDNMYMVFRSPKAKYSQQQGNWQVATGGGHDFYDLPSIMRDQKREESRRIAGYLADLNEDKF